MSSSLSEDEFHRMQIQLLELRTTNYELDGQCKKQERELISLREKVDSLDKELQKANKAIQKSKKAKEVELLIQENDQLQRKLHSQEEEFRLQNQTLMQELSSVIAANENYEKEVAAFKENRPAEDSGKQNDLAELESQIRRLQAENAALQKKCTGSENGGEGDEERGTAENTTDVSELSLSLATEKEEKKLLQEKLSALEKTSKEKIQNLQEEVEKNADKLRRKQESYLQLHAEKESVFTELSKKSDDLQAARERDQKYYTDQINKLQQELEKSKKSVQDIEDQASKHKTQSEQTISSLQQQVNAANIVENQHVKEQTEKLKQQMSQLQQQVMGLTQAKDDLTVQLQASKTAQQETSDQLLAMQQERDKSIEDWQEVNKVAEKRKTMLDELANTYQRDNAGYQEKMRVLQEENEAHMQALREGAENEKLRGSELDKIKRELEEVKKDKLSLDEAKSWLERRLGETEESLQNHISETEEKAEQHKRDHERMVESLEAEHAQKIREMTTEHKAKIQECCDKEESLRQELTSSQGEVSKLKQEIKDGTEDKKLHEKKGKTMLKDLKRQLVAERRRAEKLQDKLQEVLSDSRGNKSVEELLTTNDGNDSLDRSSLSSWSAGNSLIRDSSILSSPQNRLICNCDFLVFYKVRHLETSNAAMAEDLIQKSQIIQHYVMEQRRETRQPVHDDKLTLKKVIDLVNKHEDQNLKEMNRKLQNMLEETLTKNMHLQENLEMMSQEVVRLSKLQPNSASNDQSGGASATGS
ncbi:GRIP1-associated protein 1-like [Ostrea edulis]|uniref:GRIP1-associated protein 1-like n=1 Tax=Ostrea edulis TaxID=37623 RepID=UPI0024AFDD49|nr:GRIP1-associated protein 1-like [Ostrea edulis]